jgi:hypothetical protein
MTPVEFVIYGAPWAYLIGLAAAHIFGPKQHDLLKPIITPELLVRFKRHMEIIDEQNLFLKRAKAKLDAD